ncbi:MAG: TRAM domain-containing protein [Anaerolineaceae bacterium]|nr:TRAM domain-containing protein [Anaerolineaceae bacterium]
MSIDFIFRMIGMIIFCVLGVRWGAHLGALANANPTPSTVSLEQYAFSIGLLGALFGLVFTPYITTRPVRAIRKKLTTLEPHSLFGALAGLVIGMVIAALLAFPLSMLPAPFGEFMPFVGVVFFGYVGVSLFLTRENDMISFIRSFNPQIGTKSDTFRPDARKILLDTSVIIDGRIADIARTGFLPGVLLIPRFVLAELQYIADSPDGLRRQRGRRGMEVLSILQKEPGIPVEISDIDVEGATEVDDKLVILARQIRCPIVTNDYNLNRIAELQGVIVLNVNELANAVKSILLPGETLKVKVIQEGKEVGQGVGYMDDGTMVVVENGKHLLNRTVDVTVTKVLQTAAGRMVFARLENARHN